LFAGGGGEDRGMVVMKAFLISRLSLLFGPLYVCGEDLGEYLSHNKSWFSLLSDFALKM
jgi:hypothetical protein